MADEQTLDITADHRERGSGVMEALQRMPNVRLTIEALDLGDYMFPVSPDEMDSGATVFVVERKSAADFTASIIDQDKRLFTQSEKLKLSGLQFAFLLEGDIHAVGRIDPNAIIGAHAYLGGKRNISLFHTADPKGSAQMIATLARHGRYGLGYTISIRGTKPKADLLAAQQAFFIEGLPQLGVERVKKLLEHFKTPAALLTASEEEIAKVPGIGPKTATAIRKIMDTPWHE